MAEPDIVIGSAACDGNAKEARLLPQRLKLFVSAQVFVASAIGRQCLIRFLVIEGLAYQLAKRWRVVTRRIEDEQMSRSVRFLLEADDGHGMAYM